MKKKAINKKKIRHTRWISELVHASGAKMPRHMES